MRRLYIVPKSVWFLGAHAALFHPIVGSHYIDLVSAGVTPTSHTDLMTQFAAVPLGKPHLVLPFFQSETGGTSTSVLVCTDFHAEAPEDHWHGHGSVAILPHPTFEGTDRIGLYIGSATKRLETAHLSALADHPTLGFHAMDTVIDLGRKAAAIHPQVKLRGIL
jgi:hypothetical protein